MHSSGGLVVVAMSSHDGEVLENWRDDGLCARGDDLQDHKSIAQGE